MKNILLLSLSFICISTSQSQIKNRTAKKQTAFITILRYLLFSVRRGSWGVRRQSWESTLLNSYLLSLIKTLLTTHHSRLMYKKAPQCNGATKKWLSKPNRFFFFPLITIIHYRHTCINVFVTCNIVLHILIANCILLYWSITSCNSHCISSRVSFFVCWICVYNTCYHYQKENSCLFHCCNFFIHQN